MLIVIIAILFIVWVVHDFKKAGAEITNCLLYTSDAADE